MNAHVKILALIGTIVPLSLFTCQPNQLPHLLRELETGRNRKLEKAQNQVFETLQSNQDMPLNLFNCALDILLIRNDRTVPKCMNIQNHIKQIDNAIALFGTIPGFRSRIVHCICQSSLALSKRNWYTIAAALQIESTPDDEIVVAFGRPADYNAQLPNCSPQNIITNKRWIECKTIDWSAPFMAAGRNKRNLCRQLLRRQELVTTYNQMRAKTLSYELLCNRPVTVEWDGWLREHAIPYTIFSCV